jgi:hypothetical protein
VSSKLLLLLLQNDSCCSSKAKLNIVYEQNRNRLLLNLVEFALNAFKGHDEHELELAAQKQGRFERKGRVGRGQAFSDQKGEKTIWKKICEKEITQFRAIIFLGGENVQEKR